MLEVGYSWTEKMGEVCLVKGASVDDWVWSRGPASEVRQVVARTIPSKPKYATSAVQHPALLLLQLRRKAGSWDAPSPWALCLRKPLGPATRVGGRGSAFNTLLDPISGARCTVFPALP